MRMSCNGCRVLRKGCSEDCPIRPCLQWIKNAESQANATVFLAKFYGRAGLMSLISAGPEHLRPAIFRSLLYEACGRMANPVYGAVGLLWSGNWQTCQAAVESILKGCPVHPISPAHVQIPTEERNKTSPPAFPPTPPSPLMQSIANELHKVKTKGRFKQPQKTCELSKDLTHIVSDAEASQFCNLRWRRCYPGDFEAAPAHRLVSSDSSSETEHCDEVKNNEAGFEPATYKHNPGMDFSNIPCEPAKTQTQASGDCESDLELELTLCCQSPLSHAIEKAPNSCGEHSMPIVTSLGLGLIPIMSDAASCF